VEHAQHNSAPQEVPLSELAKGQRGQVVAVQNSDAVAVGEVGGSTIARRLLELGFIVGETVEVVARTWPDGDPMPCVPAKLAPYRYGGSCSTEIRSESLCVKQATPLVGPGRRAELRQNSTI
jgi:Fe2+ transport system protein FeoA